MLTVVHVVLTLLVESCQSTDVLTVIVLIFLVESCQITEVHTVIVFIFLVESCQITEVLTVVHVVLTLLLVLSLLTPSNSSSSDTSVYVVYRSADSSCSATPVLVLFAFEYCDTHHSSYTPKGGLSTFLYRAP